jgi:caffeoyl-CoA O-methyltransferase
MTRRIAIGLASVLLLFWLALALIYCFLLGPSAQALLSGLALPPFLAAQKSRELLRPERTFTGLDHPRAVLVLREAFGEGVAPSDGRLLYDLIVARGYRRALDLGTSRGYAALWIALAMSQTGGRLITVEIDPRPAEEARRNFRRAGLDSLIDSRINDALLEIPALPGQFDFVFMDLGAPLNKKLLDLLYARVAPGGAILAHNGFFLKSTQPGYLEAVRGDPNLDTTILPTLSGGICVTIRKRRN